MNEPTTYMCKCGMCLETGIGHTPQNQCPLEWEVKYNCGFCGEFTWSFIAHPGFSIPNLDTLQGRVICNKCKDAAYNFLIDQQKAL